MNKLQIPTEYRRMKDGNTNEPGQIHENSTTNSLVLINKIYLNLDNYEKELFMKIFNNEASIAEFKTCVKIFKENL